MTPTSAATCVLALALGAACSGRERGGAPHAAAGEGVVRPTPSRDIAYVVNCGGDFATIDLGTGAAVGEGRVPLLPAGRFDGCLVNDVRVDASGRRLYAVLASEASLSPVGTRRYRVAVLERGGGAVVRAIDIAPPLERPPAILPTRDGTSILVSYTLPPAAGRGDGIVSVLSRLNVASGEATEIARESTSRARYVEGAVVSAAFSDAALLGPGDTTIYDVDGVLVVQRHSARKRPLDRRRMLAAIKDSGALAQRGWTSLGGPHDLALDERPDAVRKTLMIADPTPGERGAFVVLDLETYHVSPVVRTPPAYPSTIRLAASGERVVIEEADERPRQGNAALYRTGYLRLYDAEQGTEQARLAVESLAGFDARVLCVAPDGKGAIVASRAGVQQLDLVTGKGRPITTHVRPDSWTRCVFVSR